MKQNLQFMRDLKPTSTQPALDHDIAVETQRIVKQFDGIVAGYTLRKQTTNLTFEWPIMSEMDIFYLNAAGDLETLNDVYPTHPQNTRLSRSRYFYGDETMVDCSAFVRVVPDGQEGVKDVFVAHATWRPFALMNRVYKVISVNGVTTVFSSSPGFICSKDDFYVTSNNLVVYETTNSIYRNWLYKLLTPESLLTFVRPVIANRLARDGDSWTKIVERYNSGTYDNQWGVIDMNLALKSKSGNLPEGTLWIAEQIPGMTRRGDVTYVLNDQGYWASYNIPFFKEIYDISGYPEHAANNIQLNYDQCARAQIFAQRAPNVTTFEDAKYLIRYNEYTTDPLSLGDPGLAIASRYDLRAGITGRAFGAIDAKVTSLKHLFPTPNSTHSTLSVDICSGPTAQDPSVTPPFDWSDPRYSNVTHAGLPQVWDFPFVSVAVM